MRTARRSPSRPEHLRQFTVFAESLIEHMLKNGARMREFAETYVASRARNGLPPVSAEDRVYARAVELVAELKRRLDLLTGRDVATDVRSTKGEVRWVERLWQWQWQFKRLVKAIVVQVNRNG